MFKTKPYNYQKEKIYEALNHLKNHNFHGFFMEVGTGKTLCALYTALKLKKENLCDGIIIVPPKALISVWLDEIKKHINLELSIFVWENNKKFTKKFQKEVSIFLQSIKFKILIINIESFQIKNDGLYRILSNDCFTQKKMIIIDESGKVKNIKAKRTINLIKYTKKLAFKIILTGTEISNSVLDLFSQFEFLKENFWSLYGKTYTQRFYIYRAKYMILKDMLLADGKSFKIPIAVKPNKLIEINQKIKPYISRALKKDCLDLPDKIYQEIEMEPNKEQKKIYNELKEKLWAEYKNQELTVTTKIALYTRFRQIAGGFMPTSGQLIGQSNPKLDFIIAETEEIENKIIIWAAFRAEIDFIVDELNKYFKINCALPLYGGQSNNERMQIVHDFKNGIKYLVANQATAAYGLNLQFCNLNYYFTNHLSPDFRMQSEGRTHRNGQNNHPIYKDLLIINTVEKKILQNLQNKKDLLREFQEMNLDDFMEVL